MRNKIPGQPEGHAEWITDHHEDGRPRYETIRETCPGAAAQPEEKSRG